MHGGFLARRQRFSSAAAPRSMGSSSHGAPTRRYLERARANGGLPPSVRLRYALDLVDHARRGAGGVAGARVKVEDVIVDGAGYAKLPRKVSAPHLSTLLWEMLAAAPAGSDDTPWTDPADDLPPEALDFFASISVRPAKDLDDLAKRFTPAAASAATRAEAKEAMEPREPATRTPVVPRENSMPTLPAPAMAQALASATSTRADRPKRTPELAAPQRPVRRPFAGLAAPTRKTSAGAIPAVVGPEPSKPVETPVAPTRPPEEPPSPIAVEPVVEAIAAPFGAAGATRRRSAHLDAFRARRCEADRIAPRHCGRRARIPRVRSGDQRAGPFDEATRPDRRRRPARRCSGGGRVALYVGARFDRAARRRRIEAPPTRRMRRPHTRRPQRQLPRLRLHRLHQRTRALRAISPSHRTWQAQQRRAHLTRLRRRQSRHRGRSAERLPRTRATCAPLVATPTAPAATAAPPAVASLLATAPPATAPTAGPTAPAPVADDKPTPPALPAAPPPTGARSEP